MGKRLSKTERIRGGGGVGGRKEEEGREKEKEKDLTVLSKALDPVLHKN